MLLGSCYGGSTGMTKFNICLHPRIDDMFKWVNNRCGPRSDNKWRLEDLTYIVFEDEKDALMFALTWL